MFQTTDGLSKEKEEEGDFSNKGTIFNLAGPSHCCVCRNGSAVPLGFGSPAQAVACCLLLGWQDSLLRACGGAVLLGYS